MIRSRPLTSRGGLKRAFSRARWPRAAMLAYGTLAFASAFAVAAHAADAPSPLTFKAPSAAPLPYDWTGFYLGGHLGDAWGSSRWSATGPGAATTTGSFDLFQPFDPFAQTGSFFDGVQAGYDYRLPNRFVLGAVVDASFPAFPNLSGISIGGSSTLTSPLLGAESYSETVLSFGTVRGRVGYAPGNWLFYATGGLAWTYDRVTLTQLGSGAADSRFLWRFGWAAGAGVEFPIAPHWTATLEYLFTDYGARSVTFADVGQRFDADFLQHELRAGVNYRFGGDAPAAGSSLIAGAVPAEDLINLRGQATFVWQAFPAIRSPFSGINSLPGSGEGRETTDVTLYAGLRLWRGAELWFNPEIDQGFGFADTHGVAGYPSGESFKLGFSYPYAHLQRYFVRQTIDLGGATEKVEADVNQFAGSQTANRLVLTVGRFTVADIFDTNKYANNPKTDFLNWSLINAGTFDYAGDGWGFTYGAAAEWYQGRFALRGGVFDLSVTPAGGVSPFGADLDPTFRQFSLVGEIEERHELWGQPGKIKITGFVDRGDAGNFQAAIDLAALTGQPANINAVRAYTSRPGVSFNLEQQITETMGVFARGGWADGNVEPWDFTDIDRTLSAGVSLSGKQWGRPDDTIGIAGVINGISGVHQQFFNAGGLGILIGDGQLPHPGLEEIIEAYYSYALSSSTRVSVDYQFIANPAYNTDRGPVNVFGGRFHWQF
jgi:high affinity Mn2+ porin